MRKVLAILAAVMVCALSSAPVAAEQPFPDRIDLPAGFAPEGIAIGPGDTSYVGSIPTGAIYKGSLRTGEGAILVPAQPGRQAVGLSLSGKGSRLFVAGGPTGHGYVYDARTGASIADYTFATAPTFINDVVVTKDGAWFTDSQRPVLYFVPIAPNGTPGTQAEVQTLALTGDFQQQPGFNLNGIDALPSGDLLVVVQSSTGKLFTVDAATGVTNEIELGGESVPNGDGILLHGRTLYVVQNQLNQVARIDLAPDLSSGVVVSRTTDPSFSVPTTAARLRNALYLVNARFGVPNPSGEFWITRLSPRP